LKCDGARAETRFRLSAKWTSPFKSAGASVQSTTGSRGVCISGSNPGYTMFRGSVKGAAYPLHSPVFPSLPLPVHHRVPSHFNWTLTGMTPLPCHSSCSCLVASRSVGPCCQSTSALPCQLSSPFSVVSHPGVGEWAC